MQTTTPRTACYAIVAGQALVAVLVALTVLVLSLCHYGDSTTQNEGYAVGGDTAIAQLGIETRGEPGVFGHLDVPGGVVNLYTAEDGLTFCPAGYTDVQCGA